MNTTGAAALAMSGLLAACAGARPRVYVGASDGFVYLLEQDSATGVLRTAERFAAGKNPWFGVFDSTRRFLYVTDLTAGEVLAFAADAVTGRLSLLGRRPVGAAPAHAALDPGEHFLLVANYTGGTVSVLPRAADGTLGEASSYPVGDKPHSVVVDRDGSFVFVTALGSDAIAQFRLDRATGRLEPADPPRVAAPAGSGPRHAILHPDGRLLLVANEKDSTVSSYALDRSRGTLSLIQSKPSLPPGFAGRNTGSDIHLSADGRFVYASNRGHHSLAVFRIDRATGALTALGHLASGGETPQSFALDARGERLVIANRTSRDLVSCRVDRASGGLRPVARFPLDVSPLWVGLP
jgi:6-phosphogluconolactonase